MIAICGLLIWISMTNGAAAILLYRLKNINYRSLLNNKVMEVEMHNAAGG